MKLINSKENITYVYFVDKMLMEFVRNQYDMVITGLVLKESMEQ